MKKVLLRATVYNGTNYNCTAGVTSVLWSRLVPTCTTADSPQPSLVSTLESRVFLLSFLKSPGKPEGSNTRLLPLWSHQVSPLPLPSLPATSFSKGHKPFPAVMASQALSNCSGPRARVHPLPRLRLFFKTEIRQYKGLAHSISLTSLRSKIGYSLVNKPLCSPLCPLLPHFSHYALFIDTHHY